MWHVEKIWLDEAEKPVGIRIIHKATLAQQDIMIDKLGESDIVLENAILTKYGVRKKKGAADIPRVRLSRHTGVEVNTYTLMHSNSVVLILSKEKETVRVIHPYLLPMSLRAIPLTYVNVYNWMRERTDHINRTYMNKVYMARRVGRDFEAILRDSCALDITDNFWIKASDIDVTWKQLNEIRDTNKALAEIALTGILREEDFKAAVNDTTSLFTLKGAFQKAILNKRIIKRDGNAEYEVAAYKLGNYLGISVAEAKLLSDGKTVSCSIFTNDKVSLAHAKDLKHICGVRNQDTYHEDIYNYFIAEGRSDLVKQLGRLYILNYLTENMDLHEENFGVLYDSSNFAFTSIAPAFDFNSAFGGWGNPQFYYSWILEKLPTFMCVNKDLLIKLSSPDFRVLVSNLPLLDKNQINSILSRADYLVSLNN